MINSMTGFGAAEGASGELRISAEIRSVNHRFFTPMLKLPQSLSAAEPELRELVRRRISRGHVTLTVRIESADGAGEMIDEVRFSAALTSLRELQKKHGLTDGPDLATLLRMPGVMRDRSDGSDAAVEMSAITDVVERAISGLEKMRWREGEELERFLREHVRLIASAVDRIAQRAPVRLREQRDSAVSSIQELAVQPAISEDRLAQEIAILVDRMEVTEELNRFQAHLQSFLETLGAPNPDGVGKRLGFILQEMLRETNTIGSKANDSAMLADVISIKEEIERLREQVENVA